MMYLFILFQVFATDVDYQSARRSYLKDVADYKESVDHYIAEATKYRNIKMNEEYRLKIVTLEKQLTAGNKDVLNTVNLYQKDNKDIVLLDDVLLMRLAQLEFERSNFEYNESAAKVNAATVEPNYSKSLEYATRLLRQYPNSSLADSAEYLIAYIYEEQADFKKAQAIYSYFLKKYPVSQYYDEVQWRLAELQFEEGEVKEARRNYLELAKRENSKFEFKALYKLGASLFETGLFDWSSKMFVRLYDRLKDDTVSSAERSTLYDETLEYLGLLQRKGVKIQMTAEVEALSAKKIQTIFLRHGLWKESEKVINDYITKYPNSKYTPDMYARWIALYEEKRQLDKAEEIRNKYLNKFIDSKEWWLANKDNFQERFFAEEQLEVNLISSARYLASIKKWDTATQRFNAFLTQYPFDPKSIDVRIELAEIYYSQQKYNSAYTTLESAPNIEMTDSQKDGFHFMRLSSYYAMNLNKSSEKIVTTMAQLANDYLNSVKNLDRAANIIKPVAEYLSNNRLGTSSLEILAKFPYEKIEYSTKSVVDLLESHIRIDKKWNQARDIASLQQKKIEVSLRKIFNLRSYTSKSFRDTYDNLVYYLSNADQDGFEAVNGSVYIKTTTDKDVYSLLQAQLLRSYGKYVESNEILDTVTEPSLGDFTQLIRAKNLYDLVDFVGCSKAVASIKTGAFKAEYPEYYKLTYDLNWITQGAKAASNSSILLAKNLKDESPIVDHLFKLPTELRLSYLKQVDKSIKGPLLDAVRSKKTCSGTVECTFATWLNSKNKESIADELITALLPQQDSRWLLAVSKDITDNHPDILLNNTISTKLRDWLQQNQLRFSVSSNYKLMDMLAKWKIATKNVVIPWDMAIYEWIDWQGSPAAIAEMQILLQEEKYTELENKLLMMHQRKTADSGMNLLKYYLFVQDKAKSEKTFSDLKDFVETSVYLAMAYVFGFSETAPAASDVDHPFVTVAAAKNYIEQNKVRDAIKKLSAAIKTNPGEEIYYYSLLQAMMYINDEVASAAVIKKAIRNSGSTFAKIVETILEGSTSSKTNIASIDKTISNLISNSENEIQIASFKKYLELARAWLANTKSTLTVENAFNGLLFLAAAGNSANDAQINDKFYTKTLNQIQRGVASEERK
jgi:TolA-binding protein/virulence-associated protein VapD